MHMLSDGGQRQLLERLVRQNAIAAETIRGTTMEDRQHYPSRTQYIVQSRDHTRQHLRLHVIEQIPSQNSVKARRGILEQILEESVRQRYRRRPLEIGIAAGFASSQSRLFRVHELTPRAQKILGSYAESLLDEKVKRVLRHLPHVENFCLGDIREQPEKFFEGIRNAAGLRGTCRNTLDTWASGGGRRWGHRARFHLQRHKLTLRPGGFPKPANTTGPSPQTPRCSQRCRDRCLPSENLNDSCGEPGLGWVVALLARGVPKLAAKL